MRTGLVVIGVVLAALGAGLILTLFFLSTGPTSTAQTRFDDPGLPTQQNQPWVIPGPAGGTGSVTLTWTASLAANVVVHAATSCVGPTGFCPYGPAALNWSSALSGQGTISSANASDYILVVSNPGSASLRFSATVSVSFTPGTPVAPWSWWLIASGGIALLSIGGIAIFLGLFLPPGVYRPPEEGAGPRLHPSLPPDDYTSLDEEQPPQ